MVKVKVLVILASLLVLTLTVLFVRERLVFAQCVSNIAPRALNGLISSQTQGPGNQFGNSVNGSNPCITDKAQAVLPSFEVPTYASLKSLYYDQFKPASATKNNVSGNANESNINGWLSPNAQSSNYVTGNIDIGTSGNTINNTTISGSNNGLAVIFVDGNLNIHNNIVYHNGTGGSLSDLNAGLVFVVGGDVNIDLPVTEVDAVIISSGTICSAYEGGCPDSSVSSSNYTNPTQETVNPLLVYGSLISLNPNKSIIFRRKLLNNNNPAEQVIQLPRYSVILRNLFSQTLSITTLNTNYSDFPGGNSPPTGANLTINPELGPYYTGYPYTLNWSSTGADINGCSASSSDNSFSGPVSTKGNITITPNSIGTHTYNLSCSNAYGFVKAPVVSINVGNNPLVISPNPVFGPYANPVGPTTLTVTWSNVPSPGSSDMLGLYSSRAPFGAYIGSTLPVTDSKCTGGGTANGSCTFQISDIANNGGSTFVPTGPYEIRYLRSDFTTVVYANLTIYN